jgi:isopenicillin N synthase-like dioxygenase
VQLQLDLAFSRDISTTFVTRKTITYVFFITLQSLSLHSTKKINPGQAPTQVIRHLSILITDYGTITLLFQDDRGGLEVLSPKGDFVPATPIPDTIVVNAGDLLQRWSNDVIRSTEHRVVSPPTPPVADKYPARYSIAYFCNPNWDATIECLDGCFGDAAGGQEKKYAPINTHKYLVSRLKATY